MNTYNLWHLEKNELGALEKTMSYIHPGIENAEAKKKAHEKLRAEFLSNMRHITRRRRAETYTIFGIAALAVAGLTMYTLQPEHIQQWQPRALRTVLGFGGIAYLSWQHGKSRALLRQTDPERGDAAIPTAPGDEKIYMRSKRALHNFSLQYMKSRMPR